MTEEKKEVKILLKYLDIILDLQSSSGCRPGTTKKLNFFISRKKEIYKKYEKT